MADAVTNSTSTNTSGAQNRGTNPYLLTSHDNPRIIITQVKLKGENFDEWSRAIRTSLHAKKKFGFVDGTITKPLATSPEYEDWWTVNSMIVSWILNTIESGLRSTIIHKELAKDLWDDIVQRFYVGNGPRAHQLKANLANCKINGDPVVQFFGRIKKLWDELQEIEGAPTCSCGKCTCGLSAKLDKKREEEHLHQFLMGLDDSFATVRSHILNTDPLPNVNRAYSLVIQEERVWTMIHQSSDKFEVMSFAAMASGGGGSDRECCDRNCNALCTHYGRKGHDKTGCFQLIGFLEWWGERRQSSVFSGPKDTTRELGSSMASPASCERSQPKANNVHGTGESPIPNLMPDQWSSLAAFFNKSPPAQSATVAFSQRLSGPNLLSSWIIDSGATHHMTRSVHVLKNLRAIAPCPLDNLMEIFLWQPEWVNFPFTKTLRLHNVSLVPALNCNLISVSQLLADCDGRVVFTKDSCTVQDRNLKMVIGTCNQRRGLYFLPEDRDHAVSLVTQIGI